MMKYKLNICPDSVTSMLPRKDGKWCKASDVDAEMDSLRKDVEALRELCGDMAEKLIFVRQNGYFPADGHWSLIKWHAYENGEDA